MEMPDILNPPVVHELVVLLPKYVPTVLCAERVATTVQVQLADHTDGYVYAQAAPFAQHKAPRSQR